MENASVLTQRPDPQVEACAGHLVPVDVGPAQGAEADERARLGVVGRRVEGHEVAAAGGRALEGVEAVAVAAAGEAGAVVQEDADVDAHDGHDAAHVEVHHEHPLENKSKHKFPGFFSKVEIVEATGGATRCISVSSSRLFSSSHPCNIALPFLRQSPLLLLLHAPTGGIEDTPRSMQPTATGRSALDPVAKNNWRRIWPDTRVAPPSLPIPKVDTLFGRPPPLLQAREEGVQKCLHARVPSAREGE